MFFENEGEVETFPDKQNLRESAPSRSALQEIIKDVSQNEMKGHKKKKRCSIRINA